MKRSYYIKPRYRILLAGCSLGLLAACAGLPPPSGAPHPVYITDTRAISLLPPSAGNQERSIHQAVEGYFGNTAVSFEGFVRMDRNEIIMIAMTPFGSGVYEIMYDGQKATVTGGMLPAGAKPEYMVADFQFCYFPADAVYRNVAAAGLNFRESTTASGWRRIIEDQGQVVMEVQRAGNELSFTNHLRHYGYIIKELPE
jgi:hypothetical protein